MFLVKPPQILTKILSDVVWNIPSKEKTLYLTFDDGPVPETTTQVLNILDEYNAKATFFCVGENVEKHPALFTDILVRGHAVGNHTYNHLKGWKTGNNEYFENVEKADSLICSDLFRPPYGRISLSQKKVLQQTYNIVLWDVLSGDYNQNLTPEQCYKHVRKHAKKGSVVVFHDSVKAMKNMLFALPKTLAYFTALGYKFDALTKEIIVNKGIKEEIHIEIPQFVPLYSTTT